MWVTDPPTEKGYYLTYYWNKDAGPNYLYKAFWWDGNQWIWKFDPDVKCYWNVRHDYYCPCQTQEVSHPYD
jgi:hypothetical protein